MKIQTITALHADRLLTGQINPQSTAPLLFIIIHTMCNFPSVRRGVEVIPTQCVLKSKLILSYNEVIQ